MSQIQIDESRCKKDGICVTDCPATILRQQDNDRFPEMVPGGEQLCLVCGHCVAVCPHGAFNHKRVPAESCPPVKKEERINSDQAVQFLRSRRSIRHFKDKAPEKAQIQKLIEIARYAPTGSNTQQVFWTVVSQKEDVRSIAEMTVEWMRQAVENPPPEGIAAYAPFLVAAWDAGADPFTRNAPVLLVASSPGGGRNSMVDLSIALSYLELAAVPMGLGTCWAGLVQAALLHSAPLKQFIGLPESHTAHYPMMLGVPKFRYHRLPERKDPDIAWK